jgi:hypothetical protein
MNTFTFTIKRSDAAGIVATCNQAIGNPPYQGGFGFTGTDANGNQVQVICNFADESQGS